MPRSCSTGSTSSSTSTKRSKRYMGFQTQLFSDKSFYEHLVRSFRSPWSGNHEGKPRCGVLLKPRQSTTSSIQRASTAITLLGQEPYRGWLRRQEVVLRQEYRAGEKLFVDYAGDTIPIYPAAAGDATAAIFVAVLGASNYTDRKSVV